MQAPTETTSNLTNKSTSTSSRRFSTNVALTLASRLVMLATGLGTSIIVARWLGAGGVGMLSVLNVAVALAVQLGCAGLPSANTFFIAKDPRQLGPAWTNSLIFGLVVGTILVLMVLAIGKLAPGVFGDVPQPLVTIAAISIPFQLIILLGLNVFIALGKIDRLNVLETVGQFLPFLNAVVLLVLLGSGLFGLVTLNTIAVVLLSVLIIATVGHVVHAATGQGLSGDLQLFKRFLRYGTKFHIAVVAGIVILRADLLLVNHFRGPKEAGVYAVATQIGNLLLLLPAVIGTLLFPRVAAETDSRGELTMRTARVTAFLMLLICLMAVPVSFLLPLVYGAEFSGAALLLLVLIPGVYLLGLEAVVVQHFNAAGLPKAIPLFWILTVCFNLALNLAFIPRYGALAAAVVSSLSYALIFLLVTTYFLVKTGNRLSQLLLIRSTDVSQMFPATRTSNRS